MYKICHLTTVHKRNDTRIFLKETLSLAHFGYDTFLIVADGREAEITNKVKIKSCCTEINNRWIRIFYCGFKILQAALQIDADLYHIHDPELIPIVMVLKKKGKKIIYDVHEDVPLDIKSKVWIPDILKNPISTIAEVIENFAAKRFNAVITATSFINDRFLALGAKAVNINNYPILSELDNTSISRETKEKAVCYVGAIGSIRGIKEMVLAMEHVDADIRLQLGGRFSEPDVEAEVKTYPVWKRVDALGWLDRNAVRALLGRSIAGLVTLHPIINYVDALPVKMFEYMAAGIPVIASNFPLWREIVEGNQCGICVDPLDPVAIARAINSLVADPELTEEMGRNGRRAVGEKYNWGIEEKKLKELYEKILSTN